MTPRIAAGSLTALLLASPALAQQPQRGTVELGLFGQYTEFDDRLQLDGALGLGGRLGVFLSPRWALEGDAGYAKISADDQAFQLGAAPRGAGAAEDYTYTPLYFRLAYNIPVGNRSGLILGAHVVRHGLDRPAVGVRTRGPHVGRVRRVRQGGALPRRGHGPAHHRGLPDR